MSADLFAAFGEPVAHTEQQNMTKSRPSDLLGIHIESPQTKPELQRAKGCSAEVSNRPPQTRARDNAVLFDASDEAELEEEFGEFEGGSLTEGEAPQHVLNAHRQASTLPSNGRGEPHESLVDLLGDSISEADFTPYTRVVTINQNHSQKHLLPISSNDEGPETAHNAATDEEYWGNFEDVGGAVSPPLTDHVLVSALEATGLEEKEKFEPDKEWEVFEDGESPYPDTSTTKLARSGAEVKTQIESVSRDHPSESYPTIRPNNIPPPAILLEVLPKVFQRLRALVGKRENPDPNFASTVVGTFATSTRIIAGRSLRWKRDTILAQSTKIGPAASGKAGGMKLASVDKLEGLKEEREASEAIMAWSRQAHFFNAVVSKHNQQRPSLMSLSSKMVVKTASGPGVLTASHPCCICGLRREERIHNVDVNVSDVFGEFWIDHWGHTDCRKFWYTNEDLLHRR